MPARFEFANRRAERKFDAMWRWLYSRSQLPEQERMIENLQDILDGVSIPMAYKIGYMSNSYREPSFRAIEAKYGLTRPEILSLIFLEFRDGIAATDICDFSGHLKANISRAVTALEGKGLIYRRLDPEDQRRQLLYIAAKGRALHARFMPDLERRERNMVQCLTAREQQQLDRLLKKMCLHAPEWSSLPLDDSGA